MTSLLQRNNDNNNTMYRNNTDAHTHHVVPPTHIACSIHMHNCNLKDFG